jgi:hypothetical protein
VLIDVASPPGTERHYDFHGLRLTLAGAPSLLAGLVARLASLPAPPPGQPDSLRFELDSGSQPSVERPPRGLRRVYEAEEGEVGYDAAGDRLYMVFADGRIRAVCDPRSGLTRVWVGNPVPDDLWLLSHPILTLPLLETLKRRGLYSLHAAGLSRAGRGLVIVGASGSGKTTLTLALARAGFDFLGDDMLFVCPRDGLLGLRAFPDEVDVTEMTLTFFPELGPLLEKRRPPGWRKWSFHAEALYGAPIAWSAQPAAVVFPRIGQSETSRLEPMAAQDALLEMLPNVLLTDPVACQAHLAALAQLSAQTPCYRLWTGRDFLDLPGLLGRLLE